MGRIQQITDLLEELKQEQVQLLSTITDKNDIIKKQNDEMKSMKAKTETAVAAATAAAAKAKAAAAAEAAVEASAAAAAAEEARVKAKRYKKAKEKAEAAKAASKEAEIKTANAAEIKAKAEKKQAEDKLKLCMLSSAANKLKYEKEIEALKKKVEDVTDKNQGLVETSKCLAAEKETVEEELAESNKNNEGFIEMFESGLLKFGKRKQSEGAESESSPSKMPKRQGTF